MKYYPLYLVIVLCTLILESIAQKALVGTNIGGWLVLEPWITPSLFYRFLGNTKSDGVGFDSCTFCEALGGKANSVMKSHWNSWVTEEHIKGLADREVEVVRLPIGDWTLAPYGPYVGCMDGAAERVTWFLDMSHKYGLKVLLDVHATVGSQNGFDNSGKASDFNWLDENNFQHWSLLNASWMGHFDGSQYTWINEQNMDFSLNVVKGLMERWGKHPALHALEPVNEPWWNSDIPRLKKFYRDCRETIRGINANILFVFHDAFITEADTWNDLFDDADADNVVLDTHKYLAWEDEQTTIGQYCDIYGATMTSQSIAEIKYPIWVGEWSLATDVCAMWLGGFNDADTPPQFPCGKVTCPSSYMPVPYGTDFDRSAAMLGPFGESTYSTIQSGMCLTDSNYFSHDDIKTLGDCTSFILNNAVAGQFLWNFRTELEPRWSYVQAYDNHWLNSYDPTYSFKTNTLHHKLRQHTLKDNRVKK